MKTHFPKLLSLFGVLLISVASAQDYTIESSSIGSGGTGTGGGYSLSSGISLTGAGQLSGGGYTMDAGFWSIPPAGQPTTIFDNTTGSANGGSGVTVTTWLASRFCLGSQPYQLDSVSLLLNSQDFSGGAGPPSTVRLQIFESDPVTGKPSNNTGLIMTLSSHTNPVALLRGQQLVRWTNAGPFTLSAGTCYWAVLSRESGGNIGQIASSTRPTGVAGTFGASLSTDAGATWRTPAEFSNHKMLVEGTLAVVAEELVLTAIAISGSDLRFSYPAMAGRGYLIESRTDLVTGEWTEVPGTGITGGGSVYQVTISISQAGSQGFYRVKQLP